MLTPEVAGEMFKDAVLARVLLLSLLLTTVSVATESVEEGELGLSLVATVLSQGDSYNSARAREKRERWLADLSNTSTTYGETPPVVLLAHELPISSSRAWTAVPLFPYLEEHYPHTRWFLFTNEETDVDFEFLRQVLDRYESSQVWFLGHALKDRTRTIIHHYLDHTSEESISYPNFPSGWLLSQPALKRAAENVNRFSPNFNIDPQFELALFLKYMRTPEIPELLPSIPSLEGDSGGYLITHVPELCMERGLGSHYCATAYTHDLPNCGEMEASKLFVGVKTCEKFHRTRLPVVQDTWAADTEGNIAYYSEVEDDEFQTTDIGVPNTESGHCGKMMAIIERFQENQALTKRRDWLVIADDDTLLSIPRLRRLLACHSPDQPILLGEVYGYNAHRTHGYRYVTGGGSMVLSRAAVKEITDRGVKCPQDSTPDDMFLGTTAEKLGIHIIHSPLFHQAQPDTFHPKVLSLQTPVSFHRHQPADPYSVYRDYLMTGEQQQQQQQQQQHEASSPPTPPSSQTETETETLSRKTEL